MEQKGVWKRLICTCLVLLLAVSLVAMGCPPPPPPPPVEPPALEPPPPPVEPPVLQPPLPPVETPSANRLLGELREGRLMPELLEEVLKDVLEERVKGRVVEMPPLLEREVSPQELQELVEGGLEVGVERGYLLPPKDLLLVEPQVSLEVRDLLRSLITLLLRELLPWWLHWIIPPMVELLLDLILGPRVLDAETLLPVPLERDTAVVLPLGELLVGEAPEEVLLAEPLLAELSLERLLKLLLVQLLIGQLEEPLPQELAAVEPLLIGLLLEQLEDPPR